MKKRVKFKNAAVEWLDYKKEFVKESTCMQYTEVVYNYLMPEIGDKYIFELKHDKIQPIILKWMDRESDSALSESTVKNIIVILKDFLKYAKKMKYIDNIDLSIQIPKRTNIKKLRVLQNEEYKKIINSITKKSILKDIGILFTLYTGLRIGEICALKWDDIDLERKIVTISKTMQRILVRENEKTYTKVIITEPKTECSIREIPLANSLTEMLKEYMPINTKTYLLTGTSAFIEPRTYRNHFNRFLKKHNISHINFHGLRHTFATKCIELGADYKTVSELLGHASVNITLNLYVHPQIEQKRRCVELLEKSYV